MKSGPGSVRTRVCPAGTPSPVPQNTASLTHSLLSQRPAWRLRPLLLRLLLHGGASPSPAVPREALAPTVPHTASWHSRCCGPCTLHQCAFGKVAGSLQPGTACCAGNECGACFLHASIGGMFYAGGTLLFGVGALAMVPIVSVFTSPLHYNVRKAFKNQHGIHHGPGCCPDLAYLCFCDPCVLCQELRELDMRRPVVTMASPMAMPTMVTAPQQGVMMMSATVQAPQQPQAVVMMPGKSV